MDPMFNNQNKSYHIFALSSSLFMLFCYYIFALIGLIEFYAVCDKSYIWVYNLISFLWVLFLNYKIGKYILFSEEGGGKIYTREIISYYIIFFVLIIWGGLELMSTYSSCIGGGVLLMMGIINWILQIIIFIVMLIPGCIITNYFYQMRRRINPEIATRVIREQEV